jgi:hypothetical protein
MDFIDTIAIPLLMGVALSAACGLRAFLPLFLLGIAAHYDLVALNQSFEWLESTPAIVAFGVAVVIEILGDKFPAVDHFLDSIAVFVKPAAAAIALAGVATNWDPVFAMVVGLIAGGTAASVVHLGKAGLRLASSMATTGTGNPILSIVEDIVSFLGTLLAMFVPIAAGIVAIFAVFALARFIKRKLSRRRSIASNSESSRAIAENSAGAEQAPKNDGAAR